MHKGILQNEIFYCNHLGKSNYDEDDIKEFYVKENSGKGLENYLRYYAFPDEDNSIMRTYMVRDVRSSELVSYFSLKAGLISLNETEISGKLEFDTLPGVELANFAVNSRYLEKHCNMKGIGSVVFGDFVRPIITDVAKSVGVKMIYIFALPYERLIDTYKTYGFLRLSIESEKALHIRLKPSYDNGCIFMYQQLQ